ncbi:psbP domain-containing protein 1, chloroplastic-like [Macadamia integrifolia]|uniref:psbP domain-containing protein 1, chloroplastic-like n=2 Tax=Macadamia integrifolia TaxID=60698 RepID=UPI001C4F601B|nr:psbP domain-containing protein 1, chloroplastic-like [Macadamia integrifolia]
MATMFSKTTLGVLSSSPHCHQKPPLPHCLILAGKCSFTYSPFSPFWTQRNSRNLVCRANETSMAEKSSASSDSGDHGSKWVSLLNEERIQLLFCKDEDLAIDNQSHAEGSCREGFLDANLGKTKDVTVSRRKAMALMFSGVISLQLGSHNITLAQPSVGFREHVDTFDGYTFFYPQNWIQVRGAGADIFFRDPFVLDENLSVELSSPSSSRYKSVEDLGPPQIAAEKVLKQYLTELMSTRLGVRRESNVLSTSSRVADDGKMYYEVEVNIKSYANNNELAVMPQDRVARLEWDRRYLSVLGVGNNRLYELRLQTPENVFQEEENDLRRVMDSFRVIKSVD